MKHLVADYCLQTEGMIQNRRRYGHHDGLGHAAVHGVGSVFAFAICAELSVLVALIVIGEMIVHYHIDWSKDNLVDRLGLTPEKRLYWVAAGTDQALHHATYLVMAVTWLVLR